MIHQRIFSFIFRPKEAARDKPNFDIALSYFVFMALFNVIAFAITDINKIFFLNEYFFGKFMFSNLFIKILLSILVVFLCIVFFMFFISLVLHLIARTYGSKGSYKLTVETLVYSMSTLLFFTLLMGLIKPLYNFVLAKPVLLVILIIYCFYVLKIAVQGMHKMKNGQSIATTIMLALYILILYQSRIDVIIFYSLVILLIYYFRTSLEANGGTLLYKTKLGLKLMGYMAKAMPRFINLIAIIGVFVGFAGMIFITLLLGYNIYELLFVPGALPGVTPILPGVEVPGSPVYLPLWYGLLAIFFVVVIHEFSHGVVSKANNVPVKSSGLFFMGPITGAFVEPDEKILKKKSYITQLSIFAAGPWSNILFTILLIFLFGLHIPSIPFLGGQTGELISHDMTRHTAILDLESITINEITYYKVNTVENNSAAYRAGIIKGMKVKSFDGINVNNQEELAKKFESFKPGQGLELVTETGSYNLVLGTHPKDANRGYMGISYEPITQVSPAALEKYGSFGVEAIIIIASLVLWLVIISFGLGLANLLPLGPVDGGRMLQVVLWSIVKDKKKADKIWGKAAIIILMILIFIMLFQFFKWVGPQIFG